MEVILREHIDNLGRRGDVVKVAAGYARNYLLPQGLAIPVSAGNKRRLEVLRQRRAERESHEFNTMSELAKSITKLTCLVKVKTGDDGKMFGSVTNGTIADELKHQFDIALDKKKIHLDHPIKTVGEFEVELRLHPEVRSSLKVKVESLNPPAAVVETAEATDKPHRTEKRGRRPEAKAETTEAAPAKPGAKAKRPEKA
jgi:large subunit ribosomal protein L9